MYSLIFLSIIFLVLLLVLKSFNVETYVNESNDYRHAKLNDFGGVDYVDNLSPYFRGEKCFEYPCPETFKRNIACWKCPWTYSLPQIE